MAILIHSKTGLPVLDPQAPPFPGSYRPNPAARKAALSSLILSVSGFRKVFAADGKEDSTTPHLSPGDQELVFGMGIAFARFLQEKTRSASPLVALGIDTRFTGPAMAEILLYALISSGCQIHYLFILPIPELLAYVRATPSIDGFVYVSASHNPIGHNGVKFGLREGVLGGKDAASLIQQYQFLLQRDSEMETLFRKASALHPNQLVEVCSSIDGWKKASEDAYRAFVYRMVTGTEDPEEQNQILEILKKNIEHNGCGIVIDYNGSARTLGIDREILKDLGVFVYELNDSPRSFSHAILPEGEALEDCRNALEELRHKDDRFRFGYVPDCDGDRGNLVYYESRLSSGNAEGARILEAQQVFALACVSELAYHHWLDRWRSPLDPGRAPGGIPKPSSGNSLSPTPSSSTTLSSSGPSRSLAVVVNDPTSLRIERIASRLHSRVFRAEVGEANVVGLAKKLIQEGWKVPLYGEGSNGGNITYPSEVRDPLATVFSILKLLFLFTPNPPPSRNSDLPPSSESPSSDSSSPDSSLTVSKERALSSPFQIWCEASCLSEGVPLPPELSTVLDTLPVFTTLPVGAKEAVFPIQCTSLSRFKAAYEQIFWKEWQARKSYLQEQWGIETWEEINYEGLEERIGTGPAFRDGAEKGGLKILFRNSLSEGVAFLWMRKSGTEPVFRILVDMEGADKDRFTYLLSWHRSMIQEADERCRHQTEPDAMNLFYHLSSLIGMELEDKRIYTYLPLIQVKEEQWASLVSVYRDQKQISGAFPSPYLSLPQQGLQLLLDPSGHIQTIFLYMSSQEGFDPFPDALPPNLSFPRTRPELQTLLGDPIESGKTQEGFLSEREEIWDVFRYLDVKIHAAYRSTDEHVTRLTLSRFSQTGARR